MGFMSKTVFRRVAPVVDFPEAEARIRANKHIAEAGDQGMAPNWKDSQGAGEGTPIYRPDVLGVAYYQFDVDGGGYIILSTGDHDAPVSHWRDVRGTRRLPADAVQTSSSTTHGWR